MGTARWVVNDRFLLEPSATHVVGPIHPGSFELDANVEAGAGVQHRAVCSEDMDGSFDAIAAGDVERISAHAVMSTAEIAGAGAHRARLRVEACRFYLVLSALNDVRSVVALRLRS